MLTPAQGGETAVTKPRRGFNTRANRRDPAIHADCRLPSYILNTTTIDPLCTPFEPVVSLISRKFCPMPPPHVLRRAVVGNSFCSHNGDIAYEVTDQTGNA